jgi:hypothetical protein
VETLTVLGAILAGVWVVEVLLYLGLYLTTRARPGVSTQPRS